MNGYTTFQNITQRNSTIPKFNFNKFASVFNNNVSPIILQKNKSFSPTIKKAVFDLTSITPKHKHNFSIHLTEKGFSLANLVNRSSHTQSLIKDSFLAALIGNLSYTATLQPKRAGLLYAYSDFGNGYISHGVGINIGSIVGFEFGFTADSFWNLGLNANINLGPFNVGGGIGISGISLSVGVTISNTTHIVGITVGWGTVALATALALTPILGARIAAACAFIFGWLF